MGVRFLCMKSGGRVLNRDRLNACHCALGVEGYPNVNGGVDLVEVYEPRICLDIVAVAEFGHSLFNPAQITFRDVTEVKTVIPDADRDAAGSSLILLLPENDRDRTPRVFCAWFETKEFTYSLDLFLVMRDTSNLERSRCLELGNIRVVVQVPLFYVSLLLAPLIVLCFQLTCGANAVFHHSQSVHNSTSIAPILMTREGQR